GFILGKLGHRVLSASNGLEALRRVEESSPDLLILDLAMPQMDGLSALRRLRGDERFRRMPVIMLTASGLERDAREAQAEGVSRLLSHAVPRESSGRDARPPAEFPPPGIGLRLGSRS